MENEILENGTAPEVEVQPTVEVQETVAVETQETVVVEPQQTVTVEPTAKTTKFDAKDNVITTNLKKVADKGKELVSDPKALWTKIKAVPKKIWIIAGGALVALIAAIVAFTLLSNTYKTPVSLLEDMANTKKASKFMDNRIAMLNGFCEDECDDILDILKKSDDYEDILLEHEEYVEECEELYGKNYKIKYKIVDKEDLEREQRKSVQAMIRYRGENMLEELEDMDSDDYEDLADEMGITKSQAKKLVKSAKEIAKIMKKAKVEEAYMLTVEKTITGSEVDDLEPEEDTTYVYKIDGRWVSTEALSVLLSLMI